MLCPSCPLTALLPTVDGAAAIDIGPATAADPDTEVEPSEASASSPPECHAKENEASVGQIIAAEHVNCVQSDEVFVESHGSADDESLGKDGKARDLQETKVAQKVPDDVNLRSGGAGDVDHNQDGAGDVDQNQDGAGDVDHNQDGAGDVDHNQDGAGDVDHNQDGAGDVDHNQDGAGDVDHNQDGAGDVDHNQDGAGDVDHNQDGAEHVDHTHEGTEDIDCSEECTDNTKGSNIFSA